jgi:hypothetical protein
VWEKGRKEKKGKEEEEESTYNKRIEIKTALIKATAIFYIRHFS